MADETGHDSIVWSSRAKLAFAVFAVIGADGVRQTALWTGISFVLNLAWEAAHIPLYTFAPDKGMRTVTYAVMHCALGDAAIALASYVAAALAVRDALWPARDPWRGGAVALVFGLGWTVYSEWQNVYVTGAWGYTSRMPTLLGIGVSPLLQWIVLPALALLMARHWQARTLHSRGGLVVAPPTIKDKG